MPFDVTPSECAGFVQSGAWLPGTLVLVKARLRWNPKATAIDGLVRAGQILHGVDLNNHRPEFQLSLREAWAASKWKHADCIADLRVDEQAGVLGMTSPVARFRPFADMVGETIMLRELNSDRSIVKVQQFAIVVQMRQIVEAKLKYPTGELIAATTFAARWARKALGSAKFTEVFVSEDADVCGETFVRFANAVGGFWPRSATPTGSMPPSRLSLDTRLRTVGVFKIVKETNRRAAAV